MIVVGDFFALGLIGILCLFYFRNRYYPSAAARCYAHCLVFAATNATLDIITAYLIVYKIGPLWLNMTLNIAYYMTNIMTTTMIGMVLFHKILEHVHDDHCIVRARTTYAIIGGIYTLIVLSNPFTNLIFYFDETGTYTHGILHWIGYLTVAFQILFVVICYYRNKKFCSKQLRATLIQILPVALVCIVLQLLYPEILLNSLIISFSALVLYLNFQNVSRGVHNITNLNDRHRFVKYIDERIEANDPFTTYVISIKNQETVNQKYGHSTADEIVYLFAFSLESLIDSSDVFHLDNLCFAICVSKRDAQKSGNIVEKIHAFIKEGVTLKDERIVFDYSILENSVIEDCKDASQYYEQLEYGIDVAEELGEKYFVYEPRLTAEMIRRRYLVTRLEHIDREHGFDVYFQPVRCMKKGIFCSMEALIRLHESDGTLISPGEFIPIAEQAGLIVPITWFVIEESCIAMANNPELKYVSVSVNVPMSQLVDTDFVDHLNSIVDKYGIEHNRICLEFTERVMLDDFARVKARMDAVSACGYRFFLDDFGTGFSNFNCLLQLPFCDVKLDKSLTDTVTSNSSEGNVVLMLTELFHKMNLKVIAEGVETEEQSRILSEYGIDRIQGYYYSAPMSLDRVLNFYREHPITEKVL